MKEELYSLHCQQLPFKYFVKFYLSFQVIVWRIKDPDNSSLRNSIFNLLRKEVFAFLSKTLGACSLGDLHPRSKVSAGTMTLWRLFLYDDCMMVAVVDNSCCNIFRLQANGEIALGVSGLPWQPVGLVPIWLPPVYHAQSLYSLTTINKTYHPFFAASSKSTKFSPWKSLSLSPSCARVVWTICKYLKVFDNIKKIKKLIEI